MEKYVLWFAKLDPFYKVLVAGALFIGIAAFGTGVATENPVFLAVGVFWLLVAPAAVWFLSAREAK